MRSELCVYDLARDLVRPILQSDRLIEAPNGTRDGTALSVNGDGWLYRVDLEAPELAEIDTGFAVTCNNDHELPPDGKLRAVSDKTEAAAARIHVLPAGGGRPERVTEKVPSYWHGWSPDGTTLAYAGRRIRQFDIYAIPVSGGSETRLTKELEHWDAPDYTPDGRWIWFNGQRDGKMQLWPMRHDGAELERMTADACCNWVPQPSPDGQNVVYLSYPAGTSGHPRDCEVEVRMMPAAGGAPRVLMQIFGGQGTINVPSWAPDGTGFAFVRYAKR